MRVPLLPDFPKPLLFAHRGLSSVCPENTMAAFRAAREAGIPGIELDVHLTKDGKLVVFHDDTTQRIVAGSGGPTEAISIEGADYAALSGLDIGVWKGPAFAGERMPLLGDVLEEFGATQYFDIEIKSRTAGDTGLERLLAKAIADQRMEGRCLVSSFNPFALRRFKAFSPDIPTAVIWSRSTELYWFLRHGEGRWIGKVDALKPEQGLLRRKRILASLRPPLLPWTVDSRADAQKLIAFGAAGIISNRPRDLGVAGLS